MKKLIQTMRDKWAKFEDRYPNTAKFTALTGIVAIGGTGVAVAAGAVAIAAGGVLFGAGMSVMTVQGFASIMAFSGAMMGALGTAMTVSLGGLQLASEAIYNSRKQTDVNEAGQTLEGPGWAVSKLERTQWKIIDLTADFKAAAQLPPDVQQEVEKAMKAAAPAVSAVKITDAGQTQAATYVFTRRISAPLPVS